MFVSFNRESLANFVGSVAHDDSGNFFVAFQAFQTYIIQECAERVFRASVFKLNRSQSVVSSKLLGVFRPSCLVSIIGVGERRIRNIRTVQENAENIVRALCLRSRREREFKFVGLADNSWYILPDFGRCSTLTGICRSIPVTIEFRMLVAER